MERCPIKIVVVHAVSKSHVVTIDHTGFVYRQSGGAYTKPKEYWRPSGHYYIRFGVYRFPVIITGNYFMLTVSLPSILRALFPAIKKDIENGTSSKQATA